MRNAAAGETALISENYLADLSFKVSAAVWSCALHIYLFVLHATPVAQRFNEIIYEKNL